MKAFLLALTIITLSSTVFAGKAEECTRLWALEKELGCPAMPAEKTEVGQALNPDKPERLSLNKSFGPTKCVLDSDIDKEKEALEKKCEAWVDKQKAHYKANFVSGNCEDSCGHGNCKNEGLSQCTFKGEVQYLVK